MTENGFDKEESRQPEQTPDENAHPIDIALRQAQDAERAGDYPVSIAAALHAIDLAQQAKNTGKQAAGYLLLRNTLYRQGNYAKATTRLEHALTLARTAWQAGFFVAIVAPLAVIIDFWYRELR